MPKCVLIVDDDETITDLIKYILESKGYEVTTALNGQDALKVMKQKPPDLILLDVQMPEMNGYGFILERDRMPSLARIPVIVLTAVEETERLFKHHGVKFYVPKPLNIKDLLEKIESLLKT